MIRPHDTNHPFNCPISYISRRSVAKDKQKGPDPQGNRMSGFRSHFYMLTDLETN